MILLLETIHPEAHARLSAAAEVRLSPTPDPDPATPWEQVEAIVTRGRGRVTKALMDRCPRLRVVARCGVGLDNVDVEAARGRGVAVVNAPGSNTTTVAEHTVALLLCLVRGIRPMAEAVAAGGWRLRDGYSGDEAAGKTLGIVGFGAIGRRVAALAGALGMEVVVAAHRGLSADHRILPLDALLAASDLVTLHLPLTPETRGLIGTATLARMKPTAFLVNTARGALIDQAALAAALERGALAGFAADVLDGEPPAADEPLLRSPRALITPHVASLTAATYRTMCLRTVDGALAALREGGL